MSDLPLIGLVGARQAGKDTAAAFLIQNHGYRRQAFADPLKREIYAAFGRYLPGITSAQAWMTWLDEYKTRPPDTIYGWVRPLLQFWGTEYRRRLCGEDYWIDKIDLAPGVVVTDARFTNELQAIKDRGGYIVRVYRAEADAASGADPHVSEQEWRSVDPFYVIHNEGTLEDLRVEVYGVLLYIQAYEQALRGAA